MTEKTFSQRLLSRKLIGLAIIYIFVNIWLFFGRLSGEQYVSIVIAIIAGLLGASYIDNKREDGGKNAADKIDLKQ